MMRDLGTAQLKRVVSKMPHRQGKLFTNAKLFPPPSGKIPGKCRQHQPSTQCNPESRLTCQHLAAEVNFCMKLQPTSQPLAHLPSQNPSSHVGSRAVEKGGGSSSIQTLPPLSGPFMIQPFTLGCPGF